MISFTTVEDSLNPTCGSSLTFVASARLYVRGASIGCR